LACNSKKELDANDYSFGFLILLLSLHYLVKCRSCSLAVYNNEFIMILGSARVGSEKLARFMDHGVHLGYVNLLILSYMFCLVLLYSCCV